MDDKDKAEVNHLGDIIEVIDIMETAYKNITEETNKAIVSMGNVGCDVYEAGAKMMAIGKRLGVYDCVLERYGQIVKLQVEKEKK